MKNERPCRLPARRHVARRRRNVRTRLRSRSRVARYGPALNSVAASLRTATFPDTGAGRHDCGFASSSASALSTNLTSAVEVASAWCASSHAKKPRSRRRSGCQAQRRVLNHRHRVLVLVPPARQRSLVESGGPASGACCETMELQGVGREAHSLVKRAEQEPRVAAGHREILTHAQDGPVSRVRKRHVIDVLTDVVLVHAYGAVVCQRYVLRVDQIDDNFRGAGVRELDMPEPRRRGAGEREAHRETDPVPFAAAPEQSFIRLEGRRTARPQERHGFDRSAEPAKVQIGRTALELVAEKKIEDKIAVVDAPDRAVCVHLNVQARRAAEEDRGNYIAHAASRSVNTGAKPPPVVRKLVVWPWYNRAATSCTRPS